MYLYAIILVVLVLIIVNAYVKRNPIARDKLTHKNKFEKQLYNPGEEIVLITEIENKSYFPMRKVYLKNTIDDSFNVIEEDNYKVTKSSTTKKELVCKLGVDKKGVTEIKTRLNVDKRGVYYIHKTNVEYNDFLGLRFAFYEKEDKQKVIVAPKRVSNKFLDKIVAQGYGDKNTKRGYINDETTIRSYSEYTGHEPMRHINWKKTAQADDFMVKQFEPMGAHITTIVFDLSGYGYSVTAGKTGEWAEYAISMLREMFEYFEEKRIPYKFFTNAKSSHIKSNYFSSTATGKKTRLDMLEMLGEMDIVLKNRDLRSGSSTLIEYALNNTEKAPMVYIAPRKKSILTNKISKVSKKKGIEIIELYASDYYREQEERK